MQGMADNCLLAFSIVFIVSGWSRFQIKARGEIILILELGMVDWA